MVVLFSKDEIYLKKIMKLQNINNVKRYLCSIWNNRRLHFFFSRTNERKSQWLIVLKEKNYLILMFFFAFAPHYRVITSVASWNIYKVMQHQPFITMYFYFDVLNREDRKNRNRQIENALRRRQQAFIFTSNIQCVSRVTLCSKFVSKKKLVNLFFTFDECLIMVRISLPLTERPTYWE